MPASIKRQFTQHEQSVAASTGYIRSADSFYRPHEITYAVDDADPLRATDRDDGVYARKIPGGYHLQVAIADVAAHIPKNNALDKAARRRAFTIYRPPARDPMFPFVLSENRFSLENEQERLTVTFNFELDENFNTVDTWFSRTVSTPLCHDYAGASARMKNPDDDFHLLAKIAMGIKGNKPEIANAELRSDEFYMDKAGHLRQADEGIISAAKMVQILMIYANNEIANLFSRTGLPFLFRNHNPGADGEQRAEYEPFHNGHYALQRDEKLQGAYSHCTSPIRRYADLVNQRVMHYCMDVFEEVAGELASIAGQEGAQRKQDMLPRVWEHGEDILKAVFAVHQERGHKRVMAEKRLKNTLRDMLDNLLGERPQHHSDPLSELMAAALRPQLPYSHDELLGMTPALNEAHEAEWEEIKALNLSNMQRWNEKIDADLAAGNFHKLSETELSYTLRRAAVTGKINEPFVHEVLKRFKSGDVDTVVDCYAVLLVNKDYDSPYWRALKRAALNHIERDPAAVHNLFEKGKKEGEIHHDTYEAKAMVRDTAADQAMPLMQAAGIEQQVNTALVVTYLPEMGDREFSAPDFSVGYTQKDALRHARFNFLRFVAFGQLGPMDQTILPTPLYAELSRGRSRAEVLAEMVESMDLTLREFGPKSLLSGDYGFSYEIFGPGLENAIRAFAVSKTAERAKEKAATQVLRNVNFKRAYANEHPVELGFPMNPAHVVRDLAEQNGWELEEPDRGDIREIERGVFEAKLKLKLGDDEVLESSSEARNKDNALMFAYENMLDKLKSRHLAPMERRSPEVEGWVTWAAGSTENTISR